MDKASMRKNNNRRISFRIYDEVHLCYKKIDEKQLAALQSGFDGIPNEYPSPAGLEKAYPDSALSPKPEKKLPDAVPPDLQFEENEICDVNISATGMAFNCEDALKEGDNLLIKMRLGTCNAIVAAYAEIVYCKNNLLSDSQYPYFIGMHFVGMTHEDREALAKHLEKRRSQQKWVNGFFLAVFIIVIWAPGEVFGLLFEFFHFLLEIFLHLLHLGFEFIESNLDHVVEHFLETDLHQTQVIVFYIILLFVGFGFYRLCRVLPSFLRRRKKNQIAFWSRKKTSLQFYWREQSLFNKLKLIIIGVSAIVGYFYFGM